MDEDKLLTIKDVRRYLQMSDSGVRKLIKDGYIPVLIIGRRTLRVRPKDLVLSMRPKPSLYLSNAPAH